MDDRISKVNAQIALENLGGAAIFCSVVVEDQNCVSKTTNHKKKHGEEHCCVANHILNHANEGREHGENLQEVENFDVHSEDSESTDHISLVEGHKGADVSCNEHDSESDISPIDCIPKTEEVA
jgi:hypothetical protein